MSIKFSLWELKKIKIRYVNILLLEIVSSSNYCKDLIEVEMCSPLRFVKLFSVLLLKRFEWLKHHTKKSFQLRLRKQRSRRVPDQVIAVDGSSFRLDFLPKIDKQWMRLSSVDYLITETNSLDCDIRVKYGKFWPSMIQN